MNKLKALTVIVIAATTFVIKAEAQKEPPPPPPIPVRPHADNDVHTEMDEVLKDHPTVADIYWENKTLMDVKLKNGKIEKYDMADAYQKKTFIDKYGDVTTFLPPPPPPPPPPIPKA